MTQKKFSERLANLSAQEARRLLLFLGLQKKDGPHSDGPEKETSDLKDDDPK